MLIFLTSELALRWAFQDHVRFVVFDVGQENLVDFSSDPRESTTLLLALTLADDRPDCHLFALAVHTGNHFCQALASILFELFKPLFHHLKMF